MNAGGARIEATLTLGYDTRQQKYVGTWIDSMQNQLWVYEGDYDPETQTLTLDTEGPNLMGDGQMTPFRDAHQFVSDDEMVSRSSAVDESGAWVSPPPAGDRPGRRGAAGAGAARCRCSPRARRSRRPQAPGRAG